jgi:hypothetical protein
MFVYLYAANFCNFIIIGSIIQLFFAFIVCTSSEDLLSVPFYISTIWDYLYYEYCLLKQGHKDTMEQFDSWGKDFDFNLPETEEGMPEWWLSLLKATLEYIITSFILILVVFFLFLVLSSLFCIAISVTLHFLKFICILKF